MFSGRSPVYKIHTKLYVCVIPKVRTQEYMRLHTLGKAMGIPSEVLDPHEAQKKFPLLDPSVFQMALFASEDGTVDPTMACNALLKVAKKHGGKVGYLTYF